MTKDKRERCESKILRLKAAQEQAKDQEIDQSVLESETSRVKAYETQIDGLQKQYERNQEINQKLLEEIRDQLRDALNMQRGNNVRDAQQRAPDASAGRREVSAAINQGDQYYDEEYDNEYDGEMQNEGDSGAQEGKEGAEGAPPLVEYRLTPKINENAETKEVDDKALEFDWPTDKDLAELRAQAEASGKDMRDIQIIGVNNNRYLQRFNFVLGNGWRSSLQARVRMFETLIQPSGAVIKKIMVFYTDRHEKSGLPNGLYGLKFLDASGAELLVAGDVKEAKGLKTHEIELEDNERVIGVKSRLNKGFPAFH